MNNSISTNVLQGIVIGLTISAVVGFVSYVYYQQYVAPKLAAAGSNPVAAAAAAFL
jgi:hypothetical protein